MYEEDFFLPENHNKEAPEGYQEEASDQGPTNDYTSASV